MKFLCSITSADNLFAYLIKLLSFISEIIINLFFNDILEAIKFKFVIVSRVSPDFETAKKHLFL